MAKAREIDDLQAELQGLQFGVSTVLGAVLQELAGSRPGGEAMLLRMASRIDAAVREFATVQEGDTRADRAHVDAVGAAMVSLVRQTFGSTSIADKVTTAGEFGILRGD